MCGYGDDRRWWRCVDVGMMSMIDDGAVMAVWMSWVCGDGGVCMSVMVW